ncbi:MAG: hypothetical protein AAF092_14180 [Pseudomonadota bacterium]
MRTILPVAAIAASFGLASAAQAATINIEYQGAASGFRSATILEAPITPAGGATPVGSIGGAFFMADASLPASDPFSNFLAWCLDLEHYLAGSGVEEYVTTTTPFSNSYGFTDPAAESRIQALFDANYYVGLENNLNESGAFQYALWEVLYDDDFSLTANTAATDEFRADINNAATAAIADTFLTNAQSYTGGEVWALTYLESTNTNTRQNIITFGLAEDMSEVPLPMSGLLLAGGLAMVGGIKRRKAAKAAAEA